jgi:hypothetical protein
MFIRGRSTLFLPAPREEERVLILPAYPLVRNTMLQENINVLERRK